jgi:hypothetical protein
MSIWKTIVDKHTMPVAFTANFFHLFHCQVGFMINLNEDHNVMTVGTRSGRLKGRFFNRPKYETCRIWIDDKELIVQ